jgi:hypothetical protein
MGAMLSGSLGVPLTAILFSIEITHSLPAMLPLMLGCTAAYAITSLIMPRSILTEKLSRRGYHLTREYGTDPLETVSVLEVMTETEPTLPEVVTLPDIYAYTDETSRAAAEKMASASLNSLIVIDRDTNEIRGTITLQDLLRGRQKSIQRENDRLRVFSTSR